MSDLSLEQIVKGLMDGYGLSREDAERSAMRTRGGRATKVDPPKVKLIAANLTIEHNGVVRGEAGIFVSIGDPPMARRTNDRLELLLLFPPRTKKNSTTMGVKQSVGYRKFKNAVVRHIKSLAGDLGLPLPDRAYNCAATFYTDTDAADTVGLMQGLADALENAGVLSSDRWIRTWNNTDQVLEKAHPRVELTLTPK